MEEIWKDIEGYEGKYQVSNLCRIRSLDRKVGNYIKEGKILKPFSNRCGYLQVDLFDSSINRKSKTIHRLVAETFIPKIEGKNEINHIDGNKNNNSINNLEWCTRLENLTHARNIGLITGESFIKSGSENWMYQRRGKDNPHSKTVIQYDKEMNKIAEYGSTSEAERKTGIYQTNIARCCRKGIKTAGGYIWRYKEE